MVVEEQRIRNGALVESSLGQVREGCSVVRVLAVDESTSRNAL